MDTDRSAERSVDDLRRRLYAPGATSADVARFETARGDVATAEPDSPRRVPRARAAARRRRLLLIAVPVVAAVATGLLLTDLRPDAAPPRPAASAPGAGPGEAILAPQSARASFVRALDAGAQAGILPYLEAHPGALPDGLRTRQRAASTEYRGEGPGAVGLDPSALAERGGHLTVIVLTATAERVAWRAVRTGAVERVVAARSGTTIAGVPVGSTVPYGPGAPTELRLRLPRGTRWGLVVDFTD